MCRAVNRYLARPARPEDVVWAYSGVRPLYDDGTADPSAVTRDYTLRVDDDAGRAPALSVFGGKITIYRRLAEQAMDKLARDFPGLKPAWTGRAPPTGRNFGEATRIEARDAFFARHARIPEATLRAIFRRHGTLAEAVVGEGDLGEDYGAGLTEREVRYFVDQEWARTAEDVLWRRSKAGLLLNRAQQERVTTALGRA